MTRRAPAATLLLALAAGLAACGSDEPQQLAAPPLEAPATATATTPAATAPATVETTTTPAGTATTPAPATTPGGATVPATTPTAPRPSGGAPAGCGTAVGGFIRDVRVSGADCTAARAVADAWFRAVHDGAAPDAPIDAAGYACSGTLAGQRASVACSAGSGRVTFSASP